MLAMRNKTRFIALLVVIVIGVMGISAYWLQGTKGQQKELTPSLPQAPEIDTSGWKTYRNEKYGFEFKYPKEFDEVEPCKLKDTDNGIELGEGRLRIEVEVFKYEHPLENHVQKFVAEQLQELGLLGLSLDEIAERNVWVSAEKILVGSNEGFKVDLPGRPSSVIFLSRGNKLYKIAWGAWGVSSCLGYAKLKGYDESQIFEQIPSTFRLY
jgi:hypothetical protein